MIISTLGGMRTCEPSRWFLSLDTYYLERAASLGENCSDTTASRPPSASNSVNPGSHRVAQTKPCDGADATNEIAPLGLAPT